MSQFNLETPSITASTTSGTELAADLSAWRTALHTSHSGATAPSYVAAGMLWYDTTNDQLKIYDGAQSIVVATVDETNNVAYPAAQNPRFAYPQDAGTANARTLTLSPAVTAYVNTDIFTFLSTATNTSPTVTMNVNGVGAKAIRKSDGSGSDIALGAGDIRDGNFYILQYSSSGNEMMLLNPSAINADSAFAVWPSGTLRTLEERATDVYCIEDAPGSPDPTGVNDSTAAFMAMAAEGVDALVTKGEWLCSETIVIAEGISWDGQGSPHDQYGASTRILFTGTGDKVHSLVGDFRSPFTVANPGVGRPYLADSGTRGNNYKFVDYTQPDGVTPILFSAGIMLNRASGIRNLGIWPYFNGLAGYAPVPALTDPPHGLGDEWDVGVWSNDANSWMVENCTVQGYWRKAALLVTSSDRADETSNPYSQNGKARDSFFWGQVGCAIRSAAVSPSWGFAGTDFVNCEFRGLHHSSYVLATSAWLTPPQPQPSACLEMAGQVVRGVEFLHCTFTGHEDISAIFHHAGDTLFNGCWFEAKDCYLSNAAGTLQPALAATTRGARLVCQSTSSVMFANHSEDSIDHAPHEARVEVPERYAAADAGVFDPFASFNDWTQMQRDSLGNTWGPRIASAAMSWSVAMPGAAASATGKPLEITGTGNVLARNVNSGNVLSTIDTVMSIPVPRTTGFCSFVYVGATGADDSAFGAVGNCGIVCYDAGAGAFTCQKTAGGAQFFGVSTDVTGATGAVGDVTIGVIDGNLRLANRKGTSRFRYFFFG